LSARSALVDNSGAKVAAFRRRVQTDRGDLDSQGDQQLQARQGDQQLQARQGDQQLQARQGDQQLQARQGDEQQRVPVE
jgi:hypothetical protein